MLLLRSPKSAPTKGLGLELAALPHGGHARAHALRVRSLRFNGRLRSDTRPWLEVEPMLRAQPGLQDELPEPSKPELCVAYYLGSTKSALDLGADFLAAETNLKADVIESSLANPSLPPRAANMDKLFEELAAAYFQKGYTVDDMSRLDHVETLPAPVACQTAIKFSDAMISLPPQRASYIFKNLQYFAAADDQRAEAPKQR